MKKVEKVFDEAEKPEHVRIREMSIADFIRWMFEKTDENHHLIVPKQSRELNGMLRRYHINTIRWTRKDRDRVIAEAEHLYETLAGIAKRYNELSDDEAENAKLLTPEELGVWRTYIRCFDMSDFDKYDNERISDLELREETSDLCRDILMKRDRYKEPLTEEEQSFLDENQRDMFNADERKYYKAYLAEVQKQAAERVGDRPTAYPLVMQAWRLCRLMSLQAPDWFVRIEATYLAQAMVFHRFATTFHVLTALGETGIERNGY